MMPSCSQQSNGGAGLGCGAIDFFVSREQLPLKRHSIFSTSSSSSSSSGDSFSDEEDEDTLSPLGEDEEDEEEYEEGRGGDDRLLRASPERRLAEEQDLLIGAAGDHCSVTSELTDLFNPGARNNEECFFSRLPIRQFTKCYVALSKKGTTYKLHPAAMNLDGCPTIGDDDFVTLRTNYHSRFSELPHDLQVCSEWKRVSKFDVFTKYPIPDGIPFFYSNTAKREFNSSPYYLLPSTLNMNYRHIPQRLLWPHLHSLKRDFPAECASLPPALFRRPSEWSLTSKFCFFSGGPINDDRDVHYVSHDSDDKPVFMLSLLSPPVLVSEFYAPDGGRFASLSELESHESVFALHARDFEDLSLAHVGKLDRLPIRARRPEGWSLVVTPRHSAARQAAVLSLVVQPNVERPPSSGPSEQQTSDPPPTMGPSGLQSESIIVAPANLSSAGKELLSLEAMALQLAEIARAIGVGAGAKQQQGEQVVVDKRASEGGNKVAEITAAAAATVVVVVADPDPAPAPAEPKAESEPKKASQRQAPVSPVDSELLIQGYIESYSRLLEAKRVAAPAALKRSPPTPPDAASAAAELHAAPLSVAVVLRTDEDEPQAAGEGAKTGLAPRGGTTTPGRGGGGLLFHDPNKLALAASRYRHLQESKRRREREGVASQK